MLRNNLLQNQWLMLAVFGGLAVMALVVLAYIAAWRRRAVPDDAKVEYSLRSFYIPWVMIVVIVGTSIWGLVFTYMAAKYPPNW